MTDTPSDKGYVISAAISKNNGSIPPLNILIKIPVDDIINRFLFVLYRNSEKLTALKKFKLSNNISISFFFLFKKLFV